MADAGYIEGGVMPVVFATVLAGLFFMKPAVIL